VVISTETTAVISVPGTFTVTAVSDLDCVSKARTIDVRKSSTAQLSEDDVTIVDGGAQNSLTIDPAGLGSGVYEYALGSSFGPFQDEPYFNDVPPGIHSLFARDKLGCGTSELLVSVIGFPNFFTPNGDGYNDTWQVQGVSFQPESHILIYDKFGKLLADLDGTSDGWNGMLNGKQLPSADYWYRVQLQDGRVKTGHFSLIR
jgi:gliding motility-associated-like protein